MASGTKWWQYVTKTIRKDTYSSAAKRVGVDKSAFTRWKNGARPDPNLVVKFARNYNRNVLEALVAAGFLTEEEADLREVDTGGTTLKEATDAELTEELLLRLRLLEEDKPIDIHSDPCKTPIDAADDFDDDAIVARINAGVERVAAQEATPPIEEHFT
jgi:hypothetical protein